MLNVEWRPLLPVVFDFFTSLRQTFSSWRLCFLFFFAGNPFFFRFFAFFASLRETSPL
jgi:hypothetical protein